ncbi:archease [Candidatus Woesearchaeota archaeon]|nr:archease [Candidatus Woesearchaeota archaeon]
MKFKYLDHTADLKLQAFGKTIEKAFVNSALGAFNYLHNTDEIRPVIKKQIKISAKRIESLLYDFLEELLFLLDTEGFLLNKIEDMKISKEYELECTAYGDSFQNYDIHGNIKSVTYSDMFIKKEDNQYVVQVVLDL